VVLISATTQGSTLAFIAHKLGLSEPTPAAPAATLEITALGDIDADIIKYTIGEKSRAAGQLLARMALPDSTVVAMITRKNSVIPPRGSTRLQAGDHLFVVLRPETRAFVDFVFSAAQGVTANTLPQRELALKGTTTVSDIFRCYGIKLDYADALTLDQIFREGERIPVEGAVIVMDRVTLHLRAMIGERIATVGIIPQHS